MGRKTKKNGKRVNTSDNVHQDLTSFSTLRKKIQRTIGRRILETYCEERDGTIGPIMIPPIPDSTFIDKLPEDGELEGQNLAEKVLQDGYEAEVKVFRSFEGTKRNVIVLHQVEYTHEQYSAFQPDHQCIQKNCKKALEAHKCHQPTKNLDGETDFVVIGDNFVAVFEVKGFKVSRDETSCSKITSKCRIESEESPSSAQNKDAVKFERYREDAVRQRKRMVDLIKSIDPLQVVYEYTVFPNISKEDVDKKYVSDKTLLYSEDLDDLYSLIIEFETKTPVLTAEDIDNSKVKTCLLGMWCIDNGNKWNCAKCSLPYCIKDTDNKLSRGLVTRKSVDEVKQKDSQRKGKGKEKVKKYPHNPQIVDAPALFKEHLKIDCLTQEQLDVFHCDERFLWINGPAGSGKTVAMLGKVVDLALRTPAEKRILLIKMVGREDCVAARNQLKLLRSVTTCDLIEYRHVKTGTNERDDLVRASRALSQRISSSESKIVLLVIRTILCTNMYSVITKFEYVFFDDYQLLVDAVTGGTLNDPQYADKDHFLSDGLLPVVQHKGKNNTKLWLLWDAAQFQDEVLMNLPKDQAPIPQLNASKAVCEELKSYFVTAKTLTVNLRNTYEISCVLSMIREHADKETFTWPRRVTWPEQRGGHFLRGTKPVFYLLRDEDPATWSIIVRREVEKLKGPDSCLGNNDIAILCHEENETIQHTFKVIKSLLGRWNTKGDKISVLGPADCQSAEWPAVISLHRYSSTDSSFRLPDGSEGRFTYSPNIPELYIAVSRARVYSVVIIFNHSNTTKHTDKLFGKLRERRDLCTVIEC